jgi:hypothetical protein
LSGMRTGTYHISAEIFLSHQTRIIIPMFFR